MPGSFKRCAIASCVTDSRVLKKLGVTLRYYSFPKDKALRDEWIFRSNKKSHDKLAKSDSICSRHFNVDDFVDALESKILNVRPKKLKAEAIPSLFLEGRPQQLIKGNTVEYHKVLAQEILNEENQAQEASNSNELPIHLEFSECMPSDCARKLVQKSSGMKKEIDEAQLLDSPSDLDPLEGLGDYNSFIDIKEESIIKPYVDINDCVENCTEDNDGVKSNVHGNDFIGNCYVCDRKIRQSDIGQYLHEDFTKIVQKVLEEISPDYVVVIKEDDGLCVTCRDLMARISRLEAELRTATLGMRALLRLKYSLPPPVMKTSKPVQRQKLQVKLDQFNSSSSSTKLKDFTTQTVKSFTNQRHKFTQVKLDQFSSNSSSTILKDFTTQTVKSFTNKRHKSTQIVPNTVLRKHQKTQTIGAPLRTKSELKKIIVCSINDIKSLETGEFEDLGKKDSDGSNVQTDVCLVQTPLHDNCLSDGITNATQMTTMLNDDTLTEECGVDTEKNKQYNMFKEENQPLIRKTKKTQISFGFLKCGRCSFKTKSAEKMKTHMISFQNKDGFYCSICDFAYHTQVRFKKHKIFHSETSKNKRCIFCNEKIHDELHMRFHIEASHRKNSFAHRCSICNAVFMFDRQMRRHQRLLHKMGVSLKCEKCDKTFNDKIKYDNHVEFYHRVSLVCKYCQQIYSTMEKLIHHENMQHRFDRKEYYQCSYCPKRFLRQELLPLHEEQHTGNFEHRCDFCNQGFHETKLLEKHQSRCKTRIKTTGKLPPNPNKSLNQNCYQYRLSLKQRMRKFKREPGHGSLVCDVCGKIIITRQKYKIHRELHDNPGAFQCHLCGKRFRYEQNMNTHIKNLHMSVTERAK